VFTLRWTKRENDRTKTAHILYAEAPPSSGRTRKYIPRCRFYTNVTIFKRAYRIKIAVGNVDNIIIIIIVVVVIAISYVSYYCGTRVFRGPYRRTASDARARGGRFFSLGSFVSVARPSSALHRRTFAGPYGNLFAKRYGRFVRGRRYERAHHARRPVVETRGRVRYVPIISAVILSFRRCIDCTARIPNARTIAGETPRRDWIVICHRWVS